MLRVGALDVMSRGLRGCWEQPPEQDREARGGGYAIRSLPHGRNFIQDPKPLPCTSLHETRPGCSRHQQTGAIHTAYSLLEIWNAKSVLRRVACSTQQGTAISVPGLNKNNHTTFNKSQPQPTPSPRCKEHTHIVTCKLYTSTHPWASPSPRRKTQKRERQPTNEG